MSRKQRPTPPESTINYWYKSALDYIKKFPLQSDKDLQKISSDLALLACRDFYGYLGVVPQTKWKATTELLYNRLKRSTIVKKQIGIGSVLIGS
jgi:hypothetical protein